MAHPGEEQFEVNLRELRELLLDGETLETSLRRVADLAVAVVPACDMCGVTLTEDGTMNTRVATDPLTNKVDDIQYGLGRGPCIDAVRTAEMFRVDDMQTETRWRTFTRQAAELGVAASLSSPLVAGGRVVGALNLYSRSGPFGAADERVVTAFSRQAGVTLANAATYEKARLLVEQLNQALASRDVIGQAKGVLMAREGISADEAFDRLRRLSQSSNVKLRDVAKQVAERSTVPPQASRAIAGSDGAR
jgi:GAF domain-containing protein